MNLSNEFFGMELDAASGIAQLRLHRPERMNTMAPAFFAALRDAVLALDAGGATRVLLIASSGKHFSAGMALDVFGADGLPGCATPRERLGFQRSLRELMRCFDVLDQARFPVVCAIHGACVGGALDLAAACDIRVASADAFFAVQEIHIGMAADLGVLQRLGKLIPEGLARELAYSGDRLDAQRALACGLVNAVLPDFDALQAHALALAQRIAARSPLAVAASKLSLNHARDHGVAESLAHMSWLQSALFDPPEMARAIDGWQRKQVTEFEPLAADRDAG
jgi:enoyl-CoA hydratase